jgi:alanine racemase
LWGPELPVEEIAAFAGTIPYELLCGVSQRVPLLHHE